MKTNEEINQQLLTERNELIEEIKRLRDALSLTHEHLKLFPYYRNNHNIYDAAIEALSTTDSIKKLLNTSLENKIGSLNSTIDSHICEECNTEMHPFAHDGISGYACADCGWSIDDEK
jgi:anaerobic ribonucleoside-triphosphate reductase